MKIINKNNYLYELQDEKGKIYNMNLEFFDVEQQIKKGDYIYINEKLLLPMDKGYIESYTFGGLKSKYGRENVRIDDIDIIKLSIDNKEIYLKRIYG